MKTPKELNKIYDKLPKQELSTQKVELGLEDDAKQEAQDLIKLRDGMGDFTSAILNAQGGLSKQIDKVRANYAPMKKIIKKYEKGLQDLGIDFEPPILRNIKDELSRTERQVKTFEKDFL